MRRGQGMIPSRLLPPVGWLCCVAAVAAESDVVGVIVQVVRADLVDGGAAKVNDRAENALQLCRRQSTEDCPQTVLLERFDLVAHARAFNGRAHEDDTTVVGNADTIDETALL